MRGDWILMAKYHLQYKKVNKFDNADYKSMMAKQVLVKH